MLANITMKHPSDIGSNEIKKTIRKKLGYGSPGLVKKSASGRKRRKSSIIRGTVQSKKNRRRSSVMNLTNKKVPVVDKSELIIDEILENSTAIHGSQTDKIIIYGFDEDTKMNTSNAVVEKKKNITQKRNGQKMDAPLTPPRKEKNKINNKNPKINKFEYMEAKRINTVADIKKTVENPSKIDNESNKSTTTMNNFLSEFSFLSTKLSFSKDDLYEMEMKQKKDTLSFLDDCDNDNNIQSDDDSDDIYI